MSRIAVMDPMNVAPPRSAPKNSITGTTSQVMVNGIAKAMSARPPMPGTKENNIASKVPATTYAKLGQDRTSNNASSAD